MNNIKKPPMPVKDNKIRMLCKKLFPYIIGGEFKDLKNLGWLPRKDTNYISLNSPIKWDHTDDNVCFNLHAWRFMSATWAHYIRNPNYETAQESVNYNIDIMLDWYNNHAKFDSKFSWYDMGVAFRALHLSFLVVLIKNYRVDLNKEKSDIFKKMIKDHVDWLSKDSNITHGNHALYEIIGLRTLEYVTDSKDNLLFCDNHLNSLLDLAFDSNFVNTENSPFYHDYNLEILKKMNFDIFPNFLDKVKTIEKEGSKVTRWLTSPCQEFYRIGDTDSKGVGLDDNDIDDNQRFTLGVHDFIFNDLAESGYQIVRSLPDLNSNDSFSFVFRGGASSNIHRHADDLSFIFFHSGVEIFTDPGKYTFNYSQDKVWSISDVSHNTVGMKLRPLKPNQIPLYETRLNNLEFSQDSIVFFGEETKADGFFHSRKISFSPLKGFDIVDKVVNRTESESEIRFLLGEKVFLEKVNNACFNIRLSNNKSLIATIDFYPVPTHSLIISKNEGKSFISKRYEEKTFVDQLILTYPSNQELIRTYVTLAKSDNDLLTEVINDFGQDLKINSLLKDNELHVIAEKKNKLENSFLEYAFQVCLNEKNKYTSQYRENYAFSMNLTEEVEKLKNIKSRIFIRDKRRPGIRYVSNWVTPDLWSLFPETGRKIKGLREFNVNGCRFIFKKTPSSNITVIGFSSIPEDGEEQKYKFLNAILNKDVNFAFFLDREAPLQKKNGTYYLSSGIKFGYLETIRDVISSIFPDCNKNNFLLIGSSKGAAAATLFGLRFGFEKLLISAPQIRIARYLNERDPVMLNEILGGMNNNDLDQLIVNQFLKLKSMNGIDVSIVIGKNDRFHLDDLSYLNKSLPELEVKAIETGGGHGGESAILYQEHLSSYLEKSCEQGFLLPLPRSFYQ